MDRQLVKVGSNGRFVIPSEYRRQLGIREGDELVIRLVDGELRIGTLSAAIKRAQQLVRQYVPEGTQLADELLQERREAANIEL